LGHCTSVREGSNIIDLQARKPAIHALFIRFSGVMQIAEPGIYPFIFFADELQRRKRIFLCLKK